MSYANLSDMLAERGVFVNRSTIYRWFIHYGPILHKKLRRYQFTRIDSSWQLDETYVRVKGKWHYLYRAINKRGETVDFFFSHKRNKEAAYQFLKRCLRRYKASFHPKALNTDTHSSYGNDATGGFKVRKRAWSTIQDFEGIRASLIFGYDVMSQS